MQLAPPPSTQTGALLLRCGFSWRAYLYFGIAGTLLLAMTLGFGLLTSLYLDNMPDKEGWLGLLFSAFAIFSGWTTFRLFQRIPQVIKTAWLFEKGLWLGGSQWFPLSQLQHLRYNGSYPLLLGTHAEGLEWISTADERVVLFDDYLDQLDAFKRQLALLRQELQPNQGRVPLERLPPLRPAEISDFGHHPLTSVSITGLLFLGGMFLYWSPKAPFFGGFAAIVLFVANHYAFHASLSKHHLLIRHPLRLGERAIPLNQIREIVRDERHRMPSRLIVITNDFRRHSWFCAPMWEKDWHELVTSAELSAVIYRYQDNGTMLIYDAPTQA